MQTEFARNGADIGRQMLTIGICRDGPATVGTCSKR